MRLIDAEALIEQAKLYIKDYEEANIANERNNVKGTVSETIIAIMELFMTCLSNVPIVAQWKNINSLEDLPPLQVRVLVERTGGQIEIAKREPRDNGVFVWEFDSGLLRAEEKVVQWQPLPGRLDSPKETEGNNCEED